MTNIELYVSACRYAIRKLVEKGSSSYVVSHNLVNEDGSVEKKYISVDWSEVSDWLDHTAEAYTKKDVIATLEELDGDIERLQLMCDKDDLNNMYQYTAFGMARDKIIEKINELRGKQDE